MIRKFVVALVLAVLAFLAFGQSPSSAQSSYNFEFFDFQTNRTTTALPFGHNNEVIVASQTQDVRNQLPISLSLIIDSSEKWSSTIPNDPTQTCRGPTGCSTHGPIISDPGTGSYVELTAKGQSGQTLATYSRGMPPSRTSETMAQVQPTNQSPGANTNPSDSWWKWWWKAGFVVGVLWLFPWVFIGWQWTRLKFWGFGWPWPWWFWIPLIWFIPWLIIGWWWWLDWWLWWVWLWWLFPWVFWWFWWLVVFKEAIIWHWRQGRNRPPL